MSTPRSNFATVILDDYIYVIGGFNGKMCRSPERDYSQTFSAAGSTTVSYVEYYDTETNQWYETSPMNLNRSALSACIISGLPNAKDYSVVGRTQHEVGQGAGMHEGDVVHDR